MVPSIVEIVVWANTAGAVISESKTATQRAIPFMIPPPQEVRYYAICDLELPSWKNNALIENSQNRKALQISVGGI
jgi:hypothetical protein